MTILAVGIDLAKNVLAVHGVNGAGTAELVRPVVPRQHLHEMTSLLPPCVIRMEACSGAHHWAQLFEAAGHTATWTSASNSTTGTSSRWRGPTSVPSNSCG